MDDTEESGATPAGAFDFTNPHLMALLGLLHGLGAAALPSRLPVPFGAVLGSAAQGALGGVDLASRVRRWPGLAGAGGRMPFGLLHPGALPPAWPGSGGG